MANQAPPSRRRRRSKTSESADARARKQQIQLAIDRTESLMKSVLSSLTQVRSQVEQGDWPACAGAFRDMERVARVATAELHEGTRHVALAATPASAPESIEDRQKVVDAVANQKFEDGIAREFGIPLPELQRRFPTELAYGLVISVLQTLSDVHARAQTAPPAVKAANEKLLLAMGGPRWLKPKRPRMPAYYFDRPGAVFAGLKRGQRKSGTARKPEVLNRNTVAEAPPNEALTPVWDEEAFIASIDVPMPSGHWEESSQE